MSSRTEEKTRAREARLAAEQAEGRAAARRRRLGILGAVLAVAAVLVGAAVFVSRSGTDEAPAAEERAALFAGIPQDGAWLGSPDAPVVLEEYADLQCPFCAQFATGDLPGIVRDYVRSGQVRLRLRVLTFLGEDSVEAGRFAVAAGLQDQMWPFVEDFYAEQGTENSGYVTEDFLRERAAAVAGLNAGRALAAADGPEVAAALEEDQRAADAAKVNSTPTFLVGRRGERLTPIESGDVRSALDAALAQGQ